ncbi:MAG: hypothetical protein PSV16_03980 [Flavobacterium sp.]|nr:hypothetical protein [Flavobacterium sp.]
MKLKSILFLLLTAVAFSSCDISGSNSSTCSQIIGIGTTAVTGPTVAAVNETIVLNVSYIRSSCATFSNFYEVNDVDGKLITVNVQVDPCACTSEETITESKNYNFKRTTAGTYVLKFKVTNTTFVTHTIVVS